MKKTLILLLLIGMISAAQGPTLNPNGMTPQVEFMPLTIQDNPDGLKKPKRRNPIADKIEKKSGLSHLPNGWNWMLPKVYTKKGERTW